MTTPANNNHAHFSGIRLSIADNQSHIYRFSFRCVCTIYLDNHGVSHSHSRLGPNRFETLFG